MVESYIATPDTASMGAGALKFFDALLELLTGNDRPKH
jgi:hypothetical protein